MNIFFKEHKLSSPSRPNDFGYSSVYFDKANDLVLFRTNECHRISETRLYKDEAIAAARAVLKHFGEGV